MRTAQQLVCVLVFATIGVRANSGHPSNCLDSSMIKSNVSDVAVDYDGLDVRVKCGDSRSSGF